MDKATSVLFYRHLDRYSGGQQKVFDYFSHLRDHRTAISFSAESIWDKSNPWFPDYQHLQVPFEPAHYNLLFLAGMDWEVYLARGIIAEKPVINLIQHVRHADPREDVHQFLTRRAIRICVSPEVTEAIKRTGLVNGPIFTIPNGLHIPEPGTEKSTGVLICGLKNAGMARAVNQQLLERGLDVSCLTDQIPRDEFLKHLSSTEIAVLLPSPSEGFYLPALEAMKLSTITIVPDCIGNRSFCFDADKDPDKGNCLMPEYTTESIVSACAEAARLSQSEDRLEAIRHNALATVDRHSLQEERRAFLDILDHVDELWAQI